MESKILNDKSSVDIAFPEVRFGAPASAPRGAHLGIFGFFALAGAARPRNGRFAPAEMSWPQQTNHKKTIKNLPGGRFLIVFW